MRDETARLGETNSRLQADVEMLNHKLRQAEMRTSQIADSKMSDDSDEVRRLQRLLDEAREENNKRVSDTAQFQQMRKMMQSQSTKLRDLRRRLQVYEPDAVKDDDY